MATNAKPAAQQKEAAPIGTPISFALSNFTAGGGFVLPEGDYRAVSHRIAMFDYDGKFAAVPVLQIHFSGLVNGQPVPGDPVPQNYTLGDAAKYGPSEDGKRIVALAGATGLSQSSNMFLYLQNLVNAGFPEDRMGDDFSVLDGMDVHLVQLVQPKRNIQRSNIAGTGQPAPADERDKTLAVPSVIHKLPWQQGGKVAVMSAPAGAKPVTAAQVAAAAPASTNGSGDPTEVLSQHLAAVIGDQTGLDLAKTGVAVFKSMNSAQLPVATRDAAMKVYKDTGALEAILMTLGEGYALDGKTIVKVG